MLRENATVFRRLALFADLCIVTASFFLGYFFRNKISGIYSLDTYAGLLFILLFIWGGLLHYFGMYNSFRIKRVPEILFILFKSALFGFIIFGSFIYILKIGHISRTFIILTFIFSAVFISISKISLMLFLRYMRKKGHNYRNILIVGTGRRAQRFIGLIDKHSEWGLKIIGLLDDDTARTGKLISGYKVVGSFKDLPAIIHNNVVDEIIFVVPRSWLHKIEEMMHFCEAEGVKVNVAVDYFELKFSRVKQTDLHGFPLLSFENTPDRLWHLLIKRCFDIVASAAGLLILAPVFASIAIVIKAASPGPVFFRQERCGLNGRRFMLYKFRTMVADAEARLEDILPYNEMSGPVFKMENDPRLTKPGRFMRKFSIDEFPQLCNVLRGDMSMVGPRPPIPSEVNKYDNWQRRRLSMKPGITCLWQANGRNKITDFNTWMKLDLNYIDNWSLWLDCKILFKTIPVVLFRVGAK